MAGRSFGSNHNFSGNRFRNAGNGMYGHDQSAPHHPRGRGGYGQGGGNYNDGPRHGRETRVFHASTRGGKGSGGDSKPNTPPSNVCPENPAKPGAIQQAQDQPNNNKSSPPNPAPPSQGPTYNQPKGPSPNGGGGPPPNQGPQFNQLNKGNPSNPGPNNQGPPFNHANKSNPPNIGPNNQGPPFTPRYSNMVNGQSGMRHPGPKFNRGQSGINHRQTSPKGRDPKMSYLPLQNHSVIPPQPNSMIRPMAPSVSPADPSQMNVVSLFPHQPGTFSNFAGNQMQQSAAYQPFTPVYYPVPGDVSSPVMYYYTYPGGYPMNQPHHHQLGQCSSCPPNAMGVQGGTMIASPGAPIYAHNPMMQPLPQEGAASPAPLQQPFPQSHSINNTQRPNESVTPNMISPGKLLA